MKVTTNDKAVQTVLDEKREIETEDLTCTGMFKIIYCFLYKRNSIFLKTKLYINFLLKYFFQIWLVLVKITGKSWLKEGE